MNLREFGSRYMHNLRRSFRFRYLETPSGSGLELAVLFALVSPITHTIGALVKTIVDAKTRNPQPQDAIMATQGRIAEAGPEEMARLLGSVDNLRPHSSSSQKLLTRLRATNRNIARQEEDAALEERYAVLGIANPTSRFEIEHALSRSLTAEQETSLTQRVEERKSVLAEERQAERKRLVTNYLGKEKNNGKLVHQRIMSFFNPQPEQLAEPLSEQSPLIQSPV
ncbi:hypothetical protein [Legionella sp. CNM-4043-24]|uniref:hypothetical protein n=1 Tax=Legionella sp. CNM-4043-24 TaxID=3421646 RepID=UPI00403AF792